MLEIEARGLTKMFGKFTAVRNLSLQVPRGTIFGFLGPNASGKSTTVKLLTGSLEPTAGAARLAREPGTGENGGLKRKLGVLPEENALFHSLTIWEHLELCGPLYGLKRAETAERATQRLRQLGLWLLPGLRCAPLLSVAAWRERLLVAIAITIVPFGASLFASGKQAKQSLLSLLPSTPAHLATLAATGAAARRRGSGARAAPGDFQAPHRTRKINRRTLAFIRARN